MNIDLVSWMNNICEQPAESTLFVKETIAPSSVTIPPSPLIRSSVNVVHLTRTFAQAVPVVESVYTNNVYAKKKTNTKIGRVRSGSGLNIFIVQIEFYL